MIKLLRGDFIRLFKSKVFWMGVLFMSGFAIVEIWVGWMQGQLVPEHPYTSPDPFLFIGTQYMGIVTAILVGSFVGTEYSNGTMKNKLTVGFSRTAIYFSSLIVCTSAVLMIHFVWLAIIILGGVIIFGQFVLSAGSVTTLILISCFSLSAFAAFFVLVCILITSKSTGAVTAVILSFLMLPVAYSLHWALTDKEFIFPEYTYFIENEDGTETEVVSEAERNPNYIGGTKRKILVAIHDLLPSNQVFQLCYDDPSINQRVIVPVTDHNIKFPLYSLSLVAVVTAAGVLLFRRKDLK